MAGTDGVLVAVRVALSFVLLIAERTASMMLLAAASGGETSDTRSGTGVRQSQTISHEEQLPP